MVSINILYLNPPIISTVSRRRTGTAGVLAGDWNSVPVPKIC